MDLRRLRLESRGRSVLPASLWFVGPSRYIAVAVREQHNTPDAPQKMACRVNRLCGPNRGFVTVENKRLVCLSIVVQLEIPVFKTHYARRGWH